MRLGTRVRAWLLVMTLMMAISPAVSAQVIEATPAGDPVVETGTGEGEDNPVADEGTTPSGDTGDAGDPQTGDTGEEPGTGGENPVIGEGPQAPAPVDAPEQGSGAPEGVTTESTPQARIAVAGDMGIMATRSLEITIVTSDGAPVPAGTEICVWNSVEWCQEWAGETLIFSPYSLVAEYNVSVPSDSDYAGLYGTTNVPSNQVVEQTLTLPKKATAEISLVGAGGATVPNGTEVCLDTASGWECQDWAGETLTFRVAPGAVEYEVYPERASGFAEAYGSFTVASGETTSQVITLEAPGTVNVTVVTADGGPLPDYVDVTIYQSFEYWDYYEGTPLTFTVTPGEVEWEIYLPWDARYHEITGTVSVASGETVDLVITLQPKGPGTLRVYVTTDDGLPVPDGTEACVNMPAPEAGDPVENLCQVVVGGMTTFTLDRGDAEVTVTPPEGSGYIGETETFRVELDTTTRVVFELSSDASTFDATIAFTISMEDGTPVDLSSVGACLYVGSLDIFIISNSCNSGYSDQIVNPDGSVTLFFDVRPGTWNYIAGADTYQLVEGTVTAVSGETTPVNIVIPSEDQEPATLSIDVVTLGGEEVPEGTEVCISGFISGGEVDLCEIWTGTTITVDIMPGIVIYGAMPPEDSGYLPTIMFEPGLIRAGEAREVVITLYPYDVEPVITMTVSDEAPRNGDEVTYTIRAVGSAHSFGPTALAYEAETHFEITDTLPGEVTNLSISCAGTYIPSIPGICHDLVGQNLSVFGGYWLTGVFDITVTVTGTVAGEPGAVVTNSACLETQTFEEDRVALDASTNMPGFSAQMAPVGESMPCASASFVIAQDQVDPTPSPTPNPGTTPTPTPEPGTTPTPVPGETPAVEHPATPGAAPVVTGLPSTGSGAGVTGSLAIYGVLVAAITLLGAGAFVRRSPGRKPA